MDDDFLVVRCRRRRHRRSARPHRPPSHAPIGRNQRTPPPPRAFPAFIHVYPRVGVDRRERAVGRRDANVEFEAVPRRSPGPPRRYGGGPRGRRGDRLEGSRRAARGGWSHRAPVGVVRRSHRPVPSPTVARRRRGRGPAFCTRAAAPFGRVARRTSRHCPSRPTDRRRRTRACHPARAAVAAVASLGIAALTAPARYVPPRRRRCPRARNRVSRAPGLLRVGGAARRCIARRSTATSTVRRRSWRAVPTLTSPTWCVPPPLRARGTPPPPPHRRAAPPPTTKQKEATPRCSDWKTRFGNDACFLRRNVVRVRGCAGTAPSRR